MRKIRALAHISLDGVIAPVSRKAGDDDYVNGAWMAPYRSVAGREAVMEAQGSGFDLILGRRTYDLWSGYWPKAADSPIARAINGATKYVATHRPESLGWGPVRHLGGDVVEGVRGVKAEAGQDLIMWGSSTVTSMLLGQGLVDEVVLFVYPVVLGRGVRLFSDSLDPRELAMVGTKALPTGVLCNSYRYVGTVATG
jgi:dihydrofolate reductase